ncbi:hypothetical protein O6H91_10G066400 [Diphasiastrum complanatum]|uniref:Uncharacterized protein n=1 Tax=Diphasiastrum complanatum TaxID=34168 RepID=A0ACC2CHV4_DIPCM|nr:hypothetical protein O6H91_10G066400 [Diphasiastrum complanatum]
MWWLNKDSLQGNDAQGKHKQRQQSNFLLRRIHKPETNPLSDLTSRNSIKTRRARQKRPERFPVPLLWLNRLSPEPPKKNASLADTKIASENGSEGEVLLIQDKRRILKAQFS